MLDWKILTNLKIYLNPNLYLGGQRTINNTFCTVCIERRYVVYCYTMFLISDQNHYCNIIWFELYPYCFVSHSIWYCCKHPNELCTPAYSSVTLVLGFSAATLKNPFFPQLLFLNSNWNLIYSSCIFYALFFYIFKNVRLWVKIM